MEIVTRILEILRRLLARTGPFLLVEIALPGGTLLALLLYVYRRTAKVSILRGADHRSTVGFPASDGVVRSRSWLAKRRYSF